MIVKKNVHLVNMVINVVMTVIVQITQNVIKQRGDAAMGSVQQDTMEISVADVLMISLALTVHKHVIVIRVNAVPPMGNAVKETAM